MGKVLCRSDEMFKHLAAQDAVGMMVGDSAESSKSCCPWVTVEVVSSDLTATDGLAWNFLLLYVAYY